jgi:hypothetical protein
MFTLYFFIYQVASALEQRSKANAKKVSTIIGVSPSAMTNLVLSMSKNRQLSQTTFCLSSSARSKKKKRIQQPSLASLTRRNTSIDDEIGTSYINHSSSNNNNNNNNQNRLSNGLDVINRSSSNETSGEHGSVAAISPNIPNSLPITRVEVELNKKLEDNRLLLPNAQHSTSLSTPPKPKISARHGNINKARKALRTITVIMGAFVLCWTPVSRFTFY